MGCAEMQGSLFGDCLEWNFEAAKISDKSSTIQQEVRFADAHE